MSWMGGGVCIFCGQNRTWFSLLCVVFFFGLRVFLFFLIFFCLWSCGGVFCPMFEASLRCRDTKRIQVFGYYRFMEAVKDRGREDVDCDKPWNRFERSRSGFLWQRAIRSYAPLHCTVQFVTGDLTCAVRVRLTSALDRLSIIDGYIHRMRVGYVCCISSGFNTQVGVANNLSICVCYVSMLLFWLFFSI